MDRYWLLTWSTYGTWAPDPRRDAGSRSSAAAGAAGAGTPVAAGPGRYLPAAGSYEVRREIAAASRYMLAAPPVWLEATQAIVVARQLRETADRRGWRVFAGSVTHSRVHLILGVEGDPDPSAMLRDLKSYASRELNRCWPGRRRWWTRSGARRRLRSASTLPDAVEWVRSRPGCLGMVEPSP